MKKLLLISLIASLLFACKKGSADLTTTLNATSYIKNIDSIAEPATVDYYLIRPENASDLKNAATVSDSCKWHSIIAFTATAYNYKNNVPPGTYILVVQVSVQEQQYNWYRYSYKNITLNAGDHLNEVMVFSHGGFTGQYQTWNSNK